MLAGKIADSEEVVSKTKNIGENLYYYILVLLVLFGGCIFRIFIIDFFIAICISIDLRLRSKNKSLSYLVIGILGGIIIIMMVANSFMPEVK